MEQEQKDLFAELLGFGFEEHLIKRALQMTNNQDQAVELILSFQEDEKNMPPQQQQNQQQGQQGIDLANVDLFQGLQFQQNQQNMDLENNPKMQNQKMVFLVRIDLKMGVGKIAAQVGHAVLGAYQQMQEIIEDEQYADKQLQEYYRQCLYIWEESGSAKIVLKCKNKEELVDLESKASNAGINTCIIQDAGKTQVEPDTMTVCAIGPAPVEDIDAITKHLDLL